MPEKVSSGPDWQTDPKYGPVEPTSPGKPASMTPHVDGHMVDNDYEQSRPSDSLVQEKFPAGPKPGLAAKP